MDKKKKEESKLQMGAMRDWKRHIREVKSN